MDPATIAAIITGGSQVLSSLFGGGSDTSATNTTTVEPASWSSLGGNGGYDLWDSAIDMILGGSIDKSGTSPLTVGNQAVFTDAALRDDLTPEERSRAKELQAWMQNNPDQATGSWGGYSWNTADLLKNYLKPEYQNQISAEYALTPSLRDMYQEDTAAKEAAGQTYLDTMTGHDTGFLNQLTGLGNKINTPAFYVNMGGKNLGVNTGGTRDAIQQLTDLATAQYGVNSAAAQRALSQAETYTPNAASLAYLGQVWPMLMQMQGLRYQTPSTTETGVYSPSLSDKLGDASTVIEQLVNLFQGNNNQQDAFHNAEGFTD